MDLDSSEDENENEYADTVHTIVVDASTFNFIDSVGVTTLIRVSRHSEEFIRVPEKLYDSSVKVASDLSSLAGQFLNGTHEFILRTGSIQNVPAHGSEPLSSPAPVCQRAGFWGLVVRNVRAPWIFPFKLA